MSRLCGILLPLLLLTSRGLADDPPKDPMLRLETGMHTGRIFHLAVDAAEKVLVTGSVDKTVRVWNFNNGKLLRTIRLPIADEAEGQVYGVAITPDGRTVACSGALGHWDQEFSIYIFDRETGALVHRITRMAAGALSLAYSPDGKFLAAGLGGSNGVQVFRVPGYEPAWSDEEYGAGENIFSIQFAIRKSDGHLLLAAGTGDGNVHLYGIPTKKGEVGTLLAKDEPPEDGIASIAFSPDASKLVVANSNSSDLRILSTDGLTELSKLTGGSDSVEIGGVAWSADGRFIAESIVHKVAGDDTSSILKWSVDGSGNPTEVTAGTGLVLHILALKRGGVAYASMRPEIGVIDKSWKRVLYVEPNALDYRGHPDQLLTSQDGGRIQYLDMWFSVSDRTLGRGECPWNNDLRHPFATASSLTLSDWRKTGPPKLADNEIERSASFSSDGEHVALGTNDGYRLFDKNGKQEWSVDGYQRDAGAINISGDGKVVVAALTDGTIRWTRSKDGELLITLYVHPDRQRWVLWTPSGYYDASPGGEELIGWHINNGADAAPDFVPVTQFRGKYHRPDVISAILKTLDEKEAVRVADADATKKSTQVSQQRPPSLGTSSSVAPVVRIAFPADGAIVDSNEIILKYLIRPSAGEPVTKVRILVNGSPAEFVPKTSNSPELLAKRANSANANLLEARLKTPDRDCEITILVEDRKTVSEPATVRLKRSSAGQLATGKQ